MSELFGSPSGDLAFREDQRQQQLAQMSLAVDSAKLQQLQTQQQMQQRLARTAQGMPQGLSPADQQYYLAQSAMNMGYVEQATERYKAGVEMQEKQETLEKGALDNQATKLDELGRFYSVVDDPQSKAQADAYWKMTHRGQPSPVAGRPWDPNFQTWLQNGITSRKEKLDMMKTQQETKTSAAAARRDDAGALLDKKTAELREAQVANLRKIGVDSPTDKMLEPISDKISARFGGTKEQARDAARSIYTKKQAIVRQAEGSVTADAAEEQAIEEARGRGDFNGFDKGGGRGGAYGARFGQRVLAASTEAMPQLTTISRLGSSTGIPTQGIFKGGVVGSSGTGTVSQIMTTERQKRYNAVVSGLAPELAAARQQGMAPGDDQIRSAKESMTILPTDSKQTAQFRVALTARSFRMAIEGGLETMTPAQKEKAAKLIKQLEAFPDPDVIDAAEPGQNMFPPGAFGAKGVTPVDKGAGKGQTSAYTPKEGDRSTSKSGKPIKFVNGQWEYVGG